MKRISSERPRRMITPASMRSAQMRVVFATFMGTACILWIGAFNSGVAKQPVFILGAAIVLTLYIAGAILAQQIRVTFSTVELVAALHVPLFFLSALLTYNVVYTMDALFFSISCVIFFFAGAKLFQTAQERNWLFDRIMIVSGVLCIVGSIQYLFTAQIPLDFFIGVDKRVGSLLANSNFFSAYILLAMPLALEKTMRTPKAQRWRFYLLAAVMTALLLATQARSSLFGCGAALFTFFLLARKNESKRIAVAAATALIVVVVAAALISPTIGTRLTTMFDLGGSFGRRTFIWSGGMNAFFASPTIGHGIGKFEPSLFEHRSPDYWKTKSEDVVAHAHNELLEIAVEYGIVGVALAAALLFLTLRHGVRLAQLAKQSEHLTAIALVSALVGIAVDNLGNVSLRQAPIALFAWLLLGVLSSINYEKQRTLSHTFSFRLPRLVAVLPFIACGTFAWWYGSIQLNVFASSVHIMRGLALPEERTSDRIRHFSAATNADSLNLLAHSLLAREFMKGQRWSEEVTRLERLLSLSPLYPKSHLMRAYALNRMNRNSEALQAIDMESRLRTHPETFEVRALAYGGLKDTTNERRALLQTIEQSIAGGVIAQIPSAIRRLLLLDRNARESQETRATLSAIRAAFSHNDDLRRYLQHVESGKQ